MPTFCDFYTLPHVPSWIFFCRPLYIHKWFLNFILPSSREKLIWSFYLLLWKQLLILIIASNFCFDFLLLLVVDFFQCTFIAGVQNNFQCHSVHSRLSEQFSESQASHGTTFRAKVCWQKAQSPKQFPKRVTGRNFTISKWFHRRNSNLYMVVFLHKMWNWKHSFKSKGPYKNFHLVTLSL
jgi:hypothetical protein